MPENSAAWITAKLAHPLEVKSAPYPTATGHQIIVKNHAVAINPMDWILQILGNVAFGWLKYPTIFGADLAGEVVEVGNKVKRFKPGDRVLGCAFGTDPKHNNHAEGGFQNYTVVYENLTAKIPQSMKYEDAAVLPLCLATAATALFEEKYLGLQLPAEPSKPSTGKTILVWGGSTSVGSNAIQLAVAAGYEVFTTCSSKNFEYVKKLGASQAFDYKKSTVVNDLIDALKHKTVAGAIAIGAGALTSCIDILEKCKSDGKRKFVADIGGPDVPREPVSGFSMLPVMFTLVSANVRMWVKSLLTGVKFTFVWGGDLEKSHVGDAIFGEFLPKALEAGTYVAAPEPQIVGHGLERIQDGFDMLRKGVSAKKLVVTL